MAVKLSNWQADYSGEIGEQGQELSLSRLGFDKESINGGSAEIKHFLPFVPNFRIQQTNITSKVSTTLSSEPIRINGETFDNEDITLKLDLSHRDFTLFYSPMNNWVNLDLGLTARCFDASAEAIGTGSVAQTVELDGCVPLAYGNLHFDLPWTGFGVGVQGNALNYDAYGLFDYSAAITFTSSGPAGFLVELGHRSFSLEADDDSDLVAKLQLKGLYLGLGLAF